jgi:pimeloyl-ACP methyl ester carboxylesterase
MMNNGKQLILKMAGIAAVTVACIAGLQQAEIRAQDRFRVPDITIEGTEKMVDVGGRNLHCFVYGKGSPTVVLVSGFNVLQVYWNAVVSPLAESATVVTYDRAGYGKSEIGNLPAHGMQSARDLNKLLEKLGAPRPYLLVGHSYGARVVRLYASLFPENTGGLILLDGQHPGILEAQKMVLRGEDRALLERMVKNMNRSGQTLRTEADYIGETFKQALQMGPLPRIPYVVVTAGKGRERGIPPGFSPEGRKNMVEVGLLLQKRLAEDIPDGKHIVLENISHMMHLEKPASVIKIILDEIERIK